MAAAPDLVALYKQMYEDQIKIGYDNKGMLRTLVRNDSEVEGISRTFPIIGISNTYQRFGSELIQPSQPVTSNVVMTFKNFEDAAELSVVDQNQINNPSYIPTLVAQQTNGIVSRVEQEIINGFSAAPVLDLNSVNTANIDNGYRINGDGSAYTNTGAEQVLDLGGLIKIKEMFDDMGIPESDRYVYIPANAFFGLATGADKDQFTNRFYSDATNLALRGIKYDNLLGLNLIVAQKNPIQGLPLSGAGTYAFAFTNDTVQLNISENGPGAQMWFEDIKYSWIFRMNVRCGAAAVRPSTFIKIACKTAT